MQPIKLTIELIFLKCLETHVLYVWVLPLQNGIFKIVITPKEW